MRRANLVHKCAIQPFLRKQPAGLNNNEDFHLLAKIPVTNLSFYSVIISVSLRKTEFRKLSLINPLLE